MVEHYLFRPLDFLRARLLSHSLRVRPLRKIFDSRLLRSLSMVVASFALNFLLMLYLPLWTLLVVPGILGMGHFIGSLSTFHQTAAPLQYAHDPLTQRRTQSTLFYACGVFGILRLIGYSGQVPGVAQFSKFVQEYFRLIDLVIVVSSFLCFLKIYRIPFLRKAPHLAGLLAYGLLMFLWPGLFWGLFIFSHNFTAFRFWHLHAPSPEEKTACWISFGLFAMIHLLVLAGGLDSSIHTIPVDQSITQIFGYSFFQISWDLFPGLYDLSFSRKIVMLLCFGQGVHYLLWIKVIPECRLNIHRPVPFSRSFRTLQQEWGRQRALFAILLVIGFGIASVLLRVDRVNDVFFSIAFYHIYAEYIALALKT